MEGMCSALLIMTVRSSYRTSPLSEFMDSAGEITKPVMAMTNEVIFSICDMNIEIGKNGMMNSGRYRGIISSIVQIPVRRCSLMKWTMKRSPFMHIMTGPGSGPVLMLLKSS